MSKLVGAELPDELFRWLTDLEANAGKIIMICTVDENGWPHPAMLSCLEVVAKDQSNIRLAPYKDSSTTRNMRRNGKLAMMIIDERVAYYIKGTVEELQRDMDSSPHVSKLNLKVEQVLTDHVDEQLERGAYVAAPPTYRDPNLAMRIAEARVVLKELLD
ncbi:MAG TPA: pyridoxamine 5'-phosphate oxidase family protein [Blastocatellia bacterium]|nr:pyridoxamine 5'-phosphate oxidase family protein [Blastocatellia bacterium]